MKPNDDCSTSCQGSYALTTACGRCIRCAEEAKQIDFQLDAHLRHQLAELHQSYMREAQPIIDRLLSMASQRVPARVFNAEGRLILPQHAIDTAVRANSRRSGGISLGLGLVGTSKGSACPNPNASA